MREQDPEIIGNQQSHMNLTQGSKEAQDNSPQVSVEESNSKEDSASADVLDSSVSLRKGRGESDLDPGVGSSRDGDILSADSDRQAVIYNNPKSDDNSSHEGICESSPSKHRSSLST